jgi:hypothetical protein
MTNRDFISQWWTDAQINKFLDPDEKRAGARLRVDEPAYQDRPDFQIFVDTLEEQPIRLMDIDNYDLDVIDAQMVTHIPPGSEEGLVDYYVEALRETYDREIIERGVYSNMYPDTPQLRKDNQAIMEAIVARTEGKSRKERWLRAGAKMAKTPILENPLYYMPKASLWGTDQKNSDSVGYAAAIKTRINWSTFDENRRVFEDEKPFGLACWNALCKYLNWTKEVPFDQLLWDQCKIEFQERRGERSEALKKMALNRTDPDFGMQIAMKTQWKLKSRDNEEGKPPQPVMIHADSYLFKFGPGGIYLLKQILKHRPDYWMFYAGMSPDDLSSWVEKFTVDVDTFFMNDLKAQDQSVRGWGMVVLEETAKFFSMPDEWIEGWHDDKMSKVWQKLIMALMTDSGEITTYLINTLSSTAREAFMFDMQPGEAMANGGDDTLKMKYKQINPEYHKFAHKDPCTDKRSSGERGEFCSFMVKNMILTKDPIILVKRWLGRVERGQAQDAILGYFSLWAFNYRARDKLYACWNEEELEAHAIMTRYMFNLKKRGISAKPDWSQVNMLGNVSDVEGLELYATMSTKLVDWSMEVVPSPTEFTSMSRDFTAHVQSRISSDDGDD